MAFRPVVTAQRIDLGWKKIKDAAKKMKANLLYVKAGVLAGKKQKRRSSAATNVEVAIFNEFGTSRTPARPFIRPAFAKNSDTYKRLFSAALQRNPEMLTSREKFRALLGLIGQKMAADMKAFVVGGDQVPPPNSEATIKRKEAKGAWNNKKRNGPDQPATGNGLGVRTLVDTSQMVNSISFAVVENGSVKEGS